MPTKRKPELTDAERHERFKEMAREVEASDDPKAFDQAFSAVVEKPSAPPSGIRAKR